MFFIKAPRKVLVIDAHIDYTNAVVFFYNSKCESLCKPTKRITNIIFGWSKPHSLSLYIRDLYIKEHIEISSCFSLNESSICCAKLQKLLQFQNSDLQKLLYLPLYIWKCFFEISLWLSLNDSSAFCARLQELLQLKNKVMLKPIYLTDTSEKKKGVSPM